MPDLKNPVEDGAPKLQISVPCRGRTCPEQYNLLIFRTDGAHTEGVVLLKRRLSAFFVPSRRSLLRTPSKNPSQNPSSLQNPLQDTFLNLRTLLRTLLRALSRTLLRTLLSGRVVARPPWCAPQLRRCSRTI